MDFPEKLTLAIKRTGSSQQKVADALGLSQTMVSRWSRGENVPDVHQAWAMARFLGVSLDYLMEDDRPALDAKGLELDREVRKLVADLGLVKSRRRLADLEPIDPAVNVVPRHESPEDPSHGAGRPPRPASGPKKSSR